MPTNRRRLAAPIAAFAAALTTTLVAGCAHHHTVAVVTTQPAAASYAPAAMGVQVGNAFDCYYLDSPAEVTNMVAAGLCPAGSIPTVMPLAWHETYYDYYLSDAYLTYVPTSYRSGWGNQWGTGSTFYKTYNVTIVKDRTTGTYKSSTGAKVTGLPKSGTTAPGSVFGGGNARTAPTLGGGNMRNPAPSAPKVNNPAPSAPKAGGFGGGNARPNPAPKPAPVVPR
jgi:hypothetical protein